MTALCVRVLHYLTCGRHFPDQVASKHDLWAHEDVSARD